MFGRSPRSSSVGASTDITPASYAPRAPPPESTSPTRGGRLAALPESLVATTNGSSPGCLPALQRVYAPRKHLLIDEGDAWQQEQRPQDRRPARRGRQPCRHARIRM